MMATRLEEDEKNENAIRDLLRKPSNCRCINCNSPEPEYACLNFWTFVCTQCSGIHREFAHRVKSVSMSKFSSEEVANFESGGNENARATFFKDWDSQRQPFPDSSNVDRLRDFIKMVYVEKRFSGERPLPRNRGKRIVSRVLVVAKTVNKETSKQNLSGYHTDKFQKVVGKADKITGFLLIYPTCCLHAIEVFILSSLAFAKLMGDTASLMAILRSLQDDISTLQSICILSFTEDVTYRFFPSWMAGFINASNLGPYEPKISKNLLSEISNLNINVLKWGKKLSEMDKIQQAQALDSVRSSTEEFLPDDPASIFSFILADETPKLEDFLEIYDLPPKDIIFDNDLVWPMPKEPFTWN